MFTRTCSDSRRAAAPLHRLAVAAALICAAAGAQAEVFTGDTSNGAIWNRPFASFSGLSTAGTGVKYEVLPFTVSVTGAYDFLNTAAASWDNFTFIYKDAFNPATPLVNGVVGNDDRPSIGLSGFNVNLTAGTNYFFITTGFDPSEFGAYSLNVSGPGSVITTPVPEPATYGLMALGLFAVAAAARRGRRAD
jgi:hypothetical protein